MSTQVQPFSYRYDNGYFSVFNEDNDRSVADFPADSTTALVCKVVLDNPGKLLHLAAQNDLLDQAGGKRLAIGTLRNINYELWNALPYRRGRYSYNSFGEGIFGLYVAGWHDCAPVESFFSDQEKVPVYVQDSKVQKYKPRGIRNDSGGHIYLKPMVVNLLKVLATKGFSDGGISYEDLEDALWKGPKSSYLPGLKRQLIQALAELELPYEISTIREFGYKLTRVNAETIASAGIS